MHSLPERKRVRLKGYDYSTPGAYFITICTHGRKQLLSNIIVGAIHESPAPLIHESPKRLIPENRLTQYGEITKQIIEMLPGRFNISIPKYVIMPNHIHLIIEIGCDISRIACIPNSRIAPKHDNFLYPFDNILYLSEMLMRMLSNVYKIAVILYIIFVTMKMLITILVIKFYE